jgi:hypothetical protein
MAEFSLETLEREETCIVRLPSGRLLEIEWLAGEKSNIYVAGFSSQEHYLADEQYRLAGYEPLLRRFSGLIAIAD